MQIGVDISKKWHSVDNSQTPIIKTLRIGFLLNCIVDSLFKLSLSFWPLSYIHIHLQKLTKSTAQQ